MNVHGHADVGFIVGRLKFEIARGVPGKYNASFDSAFVVWTNDQLTLDLFKERLKASGFTTWWYGTAHATKTKRRIAPKGVVERGGGSAAPGG